MLLLTAGRSDRAQAQQLDPAYESIWITSPGDGGTVSDSTVITGAIDFFDFVKYDLFLKRGDEITWLATGFSPVINGNLARLDPKAYMDGTYQLLIRKVHSDSNYEDVLGPTLKIDNPLGAPASFPEVEPSYLYPPIKNWARVRVRNCANLNLEFDYVSNTGFGNHGDLWMMARMEHDALCPYNDDIWIAGKEYVGTAVGEGETRGYSYSFKAQASKIYVLTYNGQPAGQFQLVIEELKGDPRADGDTGGLRYEDPARPQSPPPGAFVIASYGSPDQPSGGAAPPKYGGRAPTPATSSGGASTGSDDLLPTTGDSESAPTTFVVVALGLIMLLLLGGGMLAFVSRWVAR
jgi:hypothetical protein